MIWTTWESHVRPRTPVHLSLCQGTHKTTTIRYSPLLSLPPQTDREMKWYNQELETYLHIFCKEQPQKWLELLPMAKFTHNTAVYLVTSKSTFFLIMGYEPWSYPPLKKTLLPALKQWLNQIEDTWKEAEATHNLAQQRMKKWTFLHFKPWKARDKVWLKTRNLKLQVPSRKLSTKQIGPFEITQVISSIAFCLKLPKQWKIHDIFHAFLLSSYRETLEYSSNFPQPPPELTRTEEEYEIDKIINHWGTTARRQYLIHWKGYSNAEQTWESELNLGNALAVLKEYKNRQGLWSSPWLPTFNHSSSPSSISLKSSSKLTSKSNIQN